MERHPVDSTALASVGHDPEAEVLEIEFRTGKVYRYRGVTAQLHAWLMRSPDKGGIFNRLIDGQYPFDRIDHLRDDEPSLEDQLRASLRPPPGDDPAGG